MLIKKALSFLRLKFETAKANFLSNQELIDSIKKLGLQNDQHVLHFLYSLQTAEAIRYRALIQCYLKRQLSGINYGSQVIVSPYSTLGDTIAHYALAAFWEITNKSRLRVIVLEDGIYDTVIKKCFLFEYVTWIAPDFIDVISVLFRKHYQSLIADELALAQEVRQEVLVNCYNLIAAFLRKRGMQVNASIRQNPWTRWGDILPKLSVENPALAEAFRGVLNAPFQEESERHATQIDFLNYLDKNWGQVKLARPMSQGFSNCQKHLGLSGPYVVLHMRLLDSSNKYVRNVQQPANYLTSVRYLKSLGYQVVFLGTKSDSEFLHKRSPELLAEMLDSAGAAWQSLENDIALIENCRFFIGTSSGPTNIADLYQKPLLRLNAAELFRSENKGQQLFYPKNIQALDGRPLPVEEWLQNPGFFTDLTQRCRASGIQLIENTTEQILSATQEFVAFVNKSPAEWRNPTARQLKFRAMLRPENFYLYSIEQYPCDSYLEFMEQSGLF